MKLTKLFTYGMLATALIFAAGKVSAFPLTLKSCNGTISATPSYDAITNVDKTKYVTFRFNLKTMMTMISNTVVHFGYPPPPKDAYIAYDPYLDPYDDNGVYLTNSTGYYQSLSSTGLGNHGYYVEMQIYDMATSFQGKTNRNASASGTENDTAITFFGFRLIGLDGGTYYAAANYGIGQLQYRLSSNGKVSMSIKGAGPDYGEIDSSYDGSSQLSYNFSGSASQPDWQGPFWLWWE